ncbi:MAG: hypothetical protein NUW06_02455 [Candidatus Acetothermia bacterium]|jgi:hypothetical protein|nr:hypothetical protein [Candidatus Acetothermia bacterium]MDH7504573.1 hypothetical protein [Candidatus Acetothermia bacterium]
MNLSTGLILLGLLVGAILVVTLVSTTTPTRPEIVAIEFPEKIDADGSEVLGTVKFRDREGDIVLAEFKVIEAQAFESFSFDPEVRGQKEGSFQFYVFTILPQRVTLEVTLVDRQGHRSVPKRFSFEAELSLEF